MTTGTTMATQSKTSSTSEPIGIHAFSRSAVGYKKLRQGKASEDSSKVVRFKRTTICAVADGHGDPRCKYSGDGARYAVETACEVLRTVYETCYTEAKGDYSLYEFCANNRESFIEQIIRGWNKNVFLDYLGKNPAYAHEKEAMLNYLDRLFHPVGKLSSEDARTLFAEQDRLEELRRKIAHLYGTTLNLVMETDNFVLCIGIGDGDIISVQGKEVSWLLPPAEQFSTKTESLCCQPQKAFDAFRSVIIRKTKGKRRRSKLFDTGIHPDYILVSSDGLRNSFVDVDHFGQKLIEINGEKEEGYKSFYGISQSWIEQLTKDSLYQDDITFVFLYE